MSLPICVHQFDLRRPATVGAFLLLALSVRLRVLRVPGDDRPPTDVAQSLFLMAALASVLESLAIAHKLALSDVWVH